MSARRIAVVTGSRADYGLLKPILALLHRDRAARLQLIVTGSHLSRRFGRTIDEIRRDGFPVAAKVAMNVDRDGPGDIARAMSAATSGFAAAFERLRPDLLLLLGDRYEILSAASAALPFRLPVAHIHGGESTEGLIDEQIRHAVTKLSHLHFPVTSVYRDRLLSMGERPERVHCFGAPGLDGLSTFPFRGRKQLFREIGIPVDATVGVFTYHPVTLERGSSDRDARAVLAALEAIPNIFWICTLPNADTEYAPIIRRLKEFARRNPRRCVLRASLGRARYLSLLKYASIMVGNSSSGIIECPSFGLPAVNIGRRQQGRLRAANVIDVPKPLTEAVLRAIRRGLSAAFRRRAGRQRNPYEGRNTCRRIVQALKRTPLDAALIQKGFRSR